jgi:enoyl-CoA hydratase/carnithine racemase
MPVDYRKEDRIAVITLNREEALNAIDPAILQGLSEALVVFMHDDSSYAGIITGAGKAFSVGADVGAMLTQMKAQAGMHQAGPPTIMKGLKLWKPLIAAINGAALGGGLELALACDIRIAAENAMFAFPEVTLGLVPGWGGTQRIAHAVPLAIASELLLMGRPINAARALQTGLVNKVVPSAELMATAMSYARNICNNAPLAVRAAKQSLVQGLGLPLESGIDIEKTYNDYLASTADFEEGVRAHLEKRKAGFRAL